MPKTSPLVVAKYGELDVPFTGEGWFNATAVGEKFGKEPYEWRRLPETDRYIAALERKYGKIPYLKTKRGNSGGTWLHPKLGVRFAQWLDVDFAVWCDEQIDSILRNQSHSDHLRATAEEKEPFHHAVIHAGTVHRYPFGRIYRVADDFMGVSKLRHATAAQVRDGIEMLDRWSEKQLTYNDVARIRQNHRELFGESPQMDLLEPAVLAEVVAL